MPKKEFFRENTVAEIARNKVLVEKLLSDLENIEYIVIDSGVLVPKGYESARKFMKHGLEVRPKRFYTLDQAVQDARTPVQLREDAFNKIKNPNYCGYTFMPIGRDKRKRKVSLIECLEGARIYAFAHQTPSERIKVKPYDDSKRVRRDGAEIIVEVPSRVEGEKPVEFKLFSVPVVDAPEKHKISLGIGSDHSCGSKRYNIRYRYSDDKEGSGIVNVCAHEVSGYLEIINHYLNNEKNLIPLQMSQIAIPSQDTVDYYLKLLNNVLVKDPSVKAKNQLRKMNRAEKEIALWGFVQKLGHDKTFYAKGSRDGNVADYDWQQTV